jgi:glutaminyl-tRNA synthetase
MAVLHPLKVVIENFPEDRVEELEAINNPEDPSAGTRAVPFTRELWIERDDFREDPPKKFFRLAPGAEVRLRWAYVCKCTGVVRHERTGEIVEVRCTIDPETRNSNPTDRKIKGTIHWVSAGHALPAQVRLYDHLFLSLKPDEDENWKQQVNPKSLETLTHCFVEPSLASSAPGVHYQFERTGYFCVDPDSTRDKLVFNRTVSLRDTWGKIEKAESN